MALGSDRQIGLELLARDKTGPATKSAADNLDDVATAADKAGDSTEKLGKSSDKTGGRVAKLDREIGLLEHELHGLHEAYADAADEMERRDLGKGIRKMEADLKKVTKSRDALKKNLVADVLPDPEPEGKSFGQKLAAGMSDGISSVSGKLGQSLGPTIGVAIGAAAAPVLLGTVASVLASGAGVGVIGAGVFAAVKGDQQIQAAGKLVGTNFTAGLKSVATAEFKRPILQSLADISEAGDRMNKKLGVAFDKLAPKIRPFTRDVIAAGEAITGALIDEASDAGPAIDGLGDALRLVGDGVGDFIRIVADGGPEAASNLRLIAGAAADMLRITGTWINLFSKAANNPGITGPWLPLLKKYYDGVAASQKDVAGGAPATIEGIGLIGGAAEEAAPPIQDAADALKDFAENQLSLFNSTTDVAEAIDKVSAEFKKNGRTLDENTEKGRSNRDAIAGVAEAMNRKYDASVKTNGLGPKTDAIAKENARNFVELATKLTGSRQKAIELANKLLAIPDVTRTVTINGLSAAKVVARRISETLRAIKDENVNVNYTTSSGANSSALRAAYNKNREYGGPVKRGHAYVVGEKRAEVFVPDRDGRIVPSLEQYARSGGTSPGAGAFRASSSPAPRPAQMVVSGGGGSNNWLWEAVQYGLNNGYITVR